MIASGLASVRRRGRIALLLSLIFLSAGSCREEVYGCTDPHANNFDSSASANDGSCTYDEVRLDAETSYVLDAVLKETSGLAWWDGLLWTINDDGQPILYGLDPEDGSIRKELNLGGGEADNWESLAQDGHYFYIGSFGNNSSGNREDLHILIVEKASLGQEGVRPDTLWFSYEDQEDFSAQSPNGTDFDCEAMVAAGDRICLFTKQWISGGTTVYELPKDPGRYSARRSGEYALEGMVTGACMPEGGEKVILCGYTVLLQPFLFLLDDYRDGDFFSGNKRQVILKLPYHQIEGIASPDGLDVYMSNEYIDLPFVGSVEAKLHRVDLRNIQASVDK